MALTALVERGIGATRALVMDGDDVVEAHLERDDQGVRAGAVHVARLATILVPGHRGMVRIGGQEALLEPLPKCAEGGLVRIEVVREAIAEAGRPRLAKVRSTDGDAAPEGVVTPGLDLVGRLRAAGHAIVETGGAGIGEDRLEAAGWSEAVAAAHSGHVAFAGGLLTICPTPAMTVIDVDGATEATRLAEAAALAVAAAIRRFDITGSIGVDFPSLAGKAARARLGQILDAALPPPFERTAINGWGFVQIVRPRRRASFIEQVRAPGFAALEIMRRASRGPAGARTLDAPAAVVAWLTARPTLLAELARKCGGAVRLHETTSRGTVG